VSDLGNAHGGTWGDFDADGDLDVYVATDLGQSNRYYRNEGNCVFTRLTTGAFVQEALSNYGASSGDYDRDGDLDLFVPTARSEAPSVLYRNDSAPGNHWLEVRLQGVLSNRTALGAKVRVRATIGGVPRWQLREIQAGTGYGGHNAVLAHFGLGDAALVDSLVIEWPSGLRLARAGVTVDVVRDEVEDVTTSVAMPRASGLALGVKGGNPGAGPLTAVVDVPISAEVSLQLFDVRGRRVMPVLTRSLARGRHEIALAPRGRLPAGIYWLHVRSGAEVRSERIVRLDSPRN
jgi:hypothetical protein